MSEKIKLLIIDDSPEDREIYKRMLKSVGSDIYQFIEFDCGEDGLDYLGSETTDCVLLDYNIPDIDGMEILETLAKQESFNTPVIFLTGQGNEKVAVQAMKSGATDYLVKTDINSELLNRSIQYAIDKKDSEQKLRHYVLELEKANQQILEQQKTLIEEERLKVVLQMAGATAHEMNQPLMIMLGSIELLKIDQSVSDGVKKHITRIQDAGNRISNIVKKIQTIRQYDTEAYAGGEEIIKFDQALNLLIIEDNDNDFEELMKALSELDDIQVNRMKDISKASNLPENVDIILLDYMLPSGTGLDFLNDLEKHGVDIPVIVITGAGNEILASQSIEAGAYDYLPKSRLNKDILIRAIQNALEKHRLIKDASAAVTKMAEMSITDELTGLFNRRYFHDVLKSEISRTQRYGYEFTVFIADIDHLEYVNETYGQPAGDLILKETAMILKSCLRQVDTSCRYGGEELAVILSNTPVQQAMEMCERFRKTIADKSVDWNGSPIRGTISIGVTSFEKQSGVSFESLIQKANAALCEAKSGGRNRVCADSGH